MWPYAIWEQNWNNRGNPLVEFLGWKQSQRCSKTIPEGPLANKCDMH
jgi:hypothetical protein